jgi:hypothetical protein
MKKAGDHMREMNEYGLFEQQSGLGKRGGFTSLGQRITTRHPQLRSQRPVQPDSDEDEIYEEVYPPRLPISARRYSAGYDISDEEVYEQGNTRLHVRYVDVPKRRQSLPPPPAAPAPAKQSLRQPIYEDGQTQGRAVQPRRKLHWLFFAGLAMIIMLVGWTAINLFGTWWQTHQDDVTYGTPRTFQLDAIVGHNNDSQTSPTHFIAENLHDKIIVVEIPAGDISKSRSFAITTLTQGSELTPVTIELRDVNADGRPDLLVHIGEPGNVFTVILFNNGTQFVSKV